MLRSLYAHPNGQIPAYEWNFGDVNPPVHARTTLFLFTLEQDLGRPALRFLERSVQGLLLNFNWWVNRKDPEGRNVFAGEWLPGPGQYRVFDRSAPLPNGGRLDQADGTAWIVFYCLSMAEMALVLAEREDHPNGVMRAPSRCRTLSRSEQEGAAFHHAHEPPSDRHHDRRRPRGDRGRAGRGQHAPISAPAPVRARTGLVLRVRSSGRAAVGHYDRRLGVGGGPALEPQSAGLVVPGADQRAEHRRRALIGARVDQLLRRSAVDRRQRGSAHLLSAARACEAPLAARHWARRRPSTCE